MAIALSDDDEYPTPEWSCALCFKNFDDGEPVVYWRGGHDLYLHGGCAGSFTLRVARDAWQIERDRDDEKFTLTPHSER